MWYLIIVGVVMLCDVLWLVVDGIVVLILKVRVDW